MLTVYLPSQDPNSASIQITRRNRLPIKKAKRSEVPGNGDEIRMEVPKTSGDHIRWLLPCQCAKSCSRRGGEWWAARKIVDGGWPMLSESGLTRLPHPFAAFWRRVGSCQRGRNTHSLSPPRRPLALHFHPPFAARGPLAKTAPAPILRSFTQPPLHRIAMNIAQFFHSFLLTPHRKIVIADLPKARQVGWAQLA